MAEDLKTATVRVQRFNPDHDQKPYLDEFQVSLETRSHIVRCPANNQNDNRWQCDLS